MEANDRNIAQETSIGKLETPAARTSEEAHRNGLTSIAAIDKVKMLANRNAASGANLACPQAVEAGLPSAADSSVTADGAARIWSLTADLFPDSVQLVD